MARRAYRHPAAFGMKQLGTVVFAGFMLVVAYVILTPPSDNLDIVPSPDGTMEARLREYRYYANQPSYRIHYREAGKPLWHPLLNLPAYTNVPMEQAEPAVVWSAESDRLDFLMNGTSIWHHVFSSVK
ncbi:MAG: hypothetical protein JXR25_12075 [Pontiellaceae bacterium]|nr:hypothetical protein [Pontiellaceae bacterium]MBN2785551.1 hypothetical protein [Pontiellaceae bacterium]